MDHTPTFKKMPKCPGCGGLRGFEWGDGAQSNVATCLICKERTTLDVLQRQEGSGPPPIPVPDRISPRETGREVDANSDRRVPRYREEAPGELQRPPAAGGEERPLKNEHEDFCRELDIVLGDLRKLLVAKNEAYGNSVLDPVRIFSQADPLEQIRVRIDDKLCRLSRGHAAGEDVVQDLVGYLTIYLVAQRLEVS